MLQPVQVAQMHSRPARRADIRCTEYLERERFIAADSRAQNAVADIGQPRELAKPLYGAVCAEASAERGEYNVNALMCVGAVL